MGWNIATRCMALLGACVLVISCTKVKVGSKPNYGSATGVWVRGSFLTLPPDEARIGLCGSLRSAAAEALDEWFKVLGRKDLVRYMYGDCTADATPFSLVMWENRECSPGLTGAHELGDIPTEHKIFICSSTRQGFSPPSEASELVPSLTKKQLRSVAIHEMGHTFGLCDQYTVSESGYIFDWSFHSGCSKSVRSQEAARSVMNSISPPNLQPDDILGVRVLACLAANPINRRWAKLTSHSMKSWFTQEFVAEIDRLEKSGVKIISECKYSPDIVEPAIVPTAIPAATATAHDCTAPGSVKIVPPPNPEQRAKCIEFGGGEKACNSDCWNLEFYQNIVASLNGRGRDDSRLVTCIVNGDALNFRDTPSMQGTVITTLEKGSECRKLGETDVWYRLWCDGSEGYANKDYLICR